MKRSKVKCHICELVMVPASEDDAIQNCAQCTANMADQQAEKYVLSTAAVQMKSEDALGVDIRLILTDKRILIIDAEKEEVKTGFLGSSGGLVGGAIAGAIAGAKGAVDGAPLKLKDMVSVALDDIVSLTVEAVGLFKRFRMFKLCTKDSNSYSLVLGKKIAPEWEEEIRRRIG